MKENYRRTTRTLWSNVSRVWPSWSETSLTSLPTTLKTASAAFERLSKQAFAAVSLWSPFNCSFSPIGVTKGDKKVAGKPNLSGRDQKMKKKSGNKRRLEPTRSKERVPNPYDADESDPEDVPSSYQQVSIQVRDHGPDSGVLNGCWFCVFLICCSCLTWCTRCISAQLKSTSSGRLNMETLPALRSGRWAGALCCRALPDSAVIAENRYVTDLVFGMCGLFLNP